MMNLCADRLNRHLAGQVGIMEQLVGLLRADAPFRAVEHALGALSNLVVADTEQKTRFAKLGGITQLCRVHVRRGDKSETTAFRSKMLLVELLHTPALADETAQALAEHHIKLAASAEDEAAAGRGAPPLPPLDTGAPPASASATTEQSSRSMTPMSSSIATTDAGGDNQRL